ncbi:hypothetical protein DL96DRAFT_1580914 [Flagelloscypha sp. PMI_526]|nr:hypothetical protein DL96DRAFT_1580914 [Flagelloscypha sp. PMI_526]
MSQSSSADANIRVRITWIDHYMIKPTSYDNASTLPFAPVIRIFGESSRGLQACVNVHQVYPYFYVEYEGSLHEQRVKNYLKRLTTSLNEAIRGTMKNRKPMRYVRKCVLVKGVHFYGFHHQYSPFIKIYLADPSHIQRAVTILQNESIMATKFRVFESHLSYLLHFLVDFNLFGCDWMNIGQAYQRPISGDAEDLEEGFMLSSETRRAKCPIELDVLAGEILNRRTLEQRLDNRLLHIHPKVPEHVPLVPSVRELWEDERQRREAKGLDPEPEVPKDPSASQRGPGAGWIAEARWWALLRDRLEQGRLDPPEPVLDRRDAAPNWERAAPTMFESVDRCWDERDRRWKPSIVEEAVLPTVEDDVEMGEPDNHPEVDRAVLEGPVMTQISLSQGEEFEQDEDHGLVVQNVDDVDDVVYGVPQGEWLSDESGSQSSYVPPPMNQAALVKHPQAHTLSAPLSSQSEDSELEPPTKRARHNYSQAPTTSSSSSSESTPYTLSQPISTSSDVPSYYSRTGRYLYQFAKPPPTIAELNLQDYTKAEPVIYRDPHYSKSKDLKRWGKGVYGGVRFRRNRTGLPHESKLEPWDDGKDVEANPRLSGKKLVPVLGNTWEFARKSGKGLPTFKQVEAWLGTDEGRETRRVEELKAQGRLRASSSSQIQGSTFPKFSASPADHDSTLRQKSSMSSLAVEVLVLTRDNLFPDPTKDEVVAVWWAYQSNDEDTPLQTGMIAVVVLCLHELRDLEYTMANDELDLLNKLMDLVVELDPDILTGWEVQKMSWGYLNRRGLAPSNNLEFLEQIGRSQNMSLPGAWTGVGSQQYDEQHLSSIKVTGRHVLNLWRIVRVEHTFRYYTFEHCVYELLHQRIPHYSFKTLSTWMQSAFYYNIRTVIDYIASRTALVLKLLERLDLITKTAEFARVFGIDFFSVISRGSQFKVESFVARLAKPENFAMISPSKEQVGQQNAAECMPLILEPEARYYKDPVLVLDFQSLYPSVMIAYNLCYSTCIGESCSEWKHQVWITPNGIVYVKKEVRQGLLGRMLIEILDTRVMVKSAMKGAGDDKTLKRILDARQLGLKFIANVTYGYTGATFSGRMPAVEIADSIVQTGRETLQKAIKLIDEEPKWGGRVIYGDTDSVFVLLVGKSKDDAFKIAYEMSARVTASNPAPIKLKFEKVYMGCVLLSKKRYAGLMYEEPDQQEPAFDAKGIETVRRDGVPAQSKMVERVLKMLFRSQDLSAIKKYCCDSWRKVLEERASVYDLMFAKEVKQGTYSETAVPQPGAMVAARRQVKDHNAEALYGDRVPYVIYRHPDKTRLVERSMDPLEFVDDGHHHLDGKYYVEHVLLPPIDRILRLIGVRVLDWYNAMPKRIHASSNFTFHSKSKRNSRNIRRVHIDDHFRSINCILCGRTTPKGGVCKKCLKRPRSSIPDLSRRVTYYRTKAKDAHRICCHCTNRPILAEVKCDAFDCQWMYARKKGELLLEKADDFAELVETLNWRW